MNIAQLRKKAQFNKKVAFNNNFSRYQDGDADLLTFKAETNKIAEDLRKTKGWEFNIVKVLLDIFADDVEVFETITIGSNIQASQIIEYHPPLTPKAPPPPPLDIPPYLHLSGRDCEYNARQYYDALGIIPCSACDGLTFGSEELFTCLDSFSCTSEGPFLGGFPVDCLGSNAADLEACADDCDPGRNSPIDGYYNLALLGSPTAFVYTADYEASLPHGLVTRWQPDGLWAGQACKEYKGPCSPYRLQRQCGWVDAPCPRSNTLAYSPTSIFTPFKIGRRRARYTNFAVAYYGIPITSAGLGTQSSPYKWQVRGNQINNPQPYIWKSLEQEVARRYRTVSLDPFYRTKVYGPWQVTTRSKWKLDRPKLVSRNDVRPSDKQYSIPTTLKIRFLASEGSFEDIWLDEPTSFGGSLERGFAKRTLIRKATNEWTPRVIEVNITTDKERFRISGVGRRAVTIGESYLSLIEENN